MGNIWIISGQILNLLLKLLPLAINIWGKVSKEDYQKELKEAAKIAGFEIGDTEARILQDSLNFVFNKLWRHEQFLK